MTMAKRSKSSKPIFDEFVFWVTRPSVYYNFSLQHDRRIGDPFEERQSLRVLVECIYPDQCKGRVADAAIMPDPDMAEGSKFRIRPPEEPPKAIGSIIVGKDRFEVSVFLPPDACWGLAAAMANGTITSMSAGSHWPRPGHGYINSISFHGPDFDPVAYVG
jgi:hypothetical protein